MIVFIAILVCFGWFSVLMERFVLKVLGRCLDDGNITKKITSGLKDKF